MAEEKTVEDFLVNTEPWLWPDALKQNVEAEQLDLIAESIMVIEEEYQDLLKRLEIEKQKAKHFKEMKKMKKKYDESLTQQIKEAEAELEKLDEEILMIKLEKTPKLMQLNADIAFMKDVVAKKEALLDQYMLEYNEFPMVKEIERIKNETLKLRVNRMMDEYRKESQDRMNKMQIEITKKLEQNAIIELAKAWKVHMEKIKRNAEADRVNAQLEKEIEELKEMKRMMDARKAEEKRQEMLVRSLMPPPAAKILAQVKKVKTISDDDSDKQSVFSMILDDMISSDHEEVLHGSDIVSSSVEDFQVDNVNLEKPLAASPKIPSFSKVAETRSIHSPIKEKSTSFFGLLRNEDVEEETMDVEVSNISEHQNTSIVAEMNDRRNMETVESFCDCTSTSEMSMSSIQLTQEVDQSVLKKKPEIKKVERVSYTLPIIKAQPMETSNQPTHQAENNQMENIEDQNENEVSMSEMEVEDNLPTDLEESCLSQKAKKSNESSFSNMSNITYKLFKFATNEPTESCVQQKSPIREDFNEDGSRVLDITPQTSLDDMSSVFSSAKVLPETASSQAGNEHQKQPQVGSNGNEQMQLETQSESSFFAF